MLPVITTVMPCCTGLPVASITLAFVSTVIGPSTACGAAGAGAISSIDRARSIMILEVFMAWSPRCGEL